MSHRTLLTTAEAAALMGISVEDLAVLRRGDRRPEWGRFGGAIRYDARDVATWINDHQQ